MLLGWLVIGHGSVQARGVDLIAIGTLVTAACTLGLAGATYYLGVRTGDVVDASRDEAQAARDDLAVAREQATTAREALDAQTQPFLTVGAVRPDLFHVVSGPDGDVRASAHVRNAGNATAIITSVVFMFPGGHTFSGGAPDPAVPAGESTAVRFVIPVDSNLHDQAHTQTAHAENFSVAVAFADVSARSRGAVRLDVMRAPVTELGRPWYVRQVFWADTLDAVRNEPAIGSQPAEYQRRVVDPLLREGMQRDARSADDALTAIDARIKDDSTTPGALHNEWQDKVLPLAERIRDPEIQRRARLVGWMLFLAFQAGADSPWQFAGLRATEDLHDALRALMHDEPFPSPRFPDEKTLRTLVGTGRPTFEELGQWLTQR